MPSRLRIARRSGYTGRMFEEAQLYSPVTANEDGTVTVELAKDHPGASDPAYRERRNEIAAAALAWKPGTPIPRIEYTEAEHEVWRIVSRELAPKHAASTRAATSARAPPRWRCRPTTSRSSTRSRAGLEPLTGFRYDAAAGLVPLRDFLGALGDRIFHSTQYIRHGAVPLYTPEPDLIHEVIGHGNLLAAPRFAAIKRQAGLAAQRVETDDALQFLADVFWFTIEFGVMREEGEVRAYGAGILSSYGEIEEFRGADLRPLDLLEMGTLEYDITKYQPVLFCADGMGELEDVVGGFFAAFDDDTPARLRRDAGASAGRVGASAGGPVSADPAPARPWREGGEQAMDYQIDHDPIERGHLVVASGELDIRPRRACRRCSRWRRRALAGGSCSTSAKWPSSTRRRSGRSSRRPRSSTRRGTQPRGRGPGGPGAPAAGDDEPDPAVPAVRRRAPPRLSADGAPA